MYEEFLAPLTRRRNQLREQLKISVSAKEREALEAKLAEVEVERTATEEYLIGFAGHLKEFEKKMVSDKLDESLFPKSMQVKEFQPGRLLRVAVLSTLDEKISRGAVAFLYALAVVALVGMFVPLPIWLTAPIIIYGAYRLYLLNTMTFHLIRQQISYVTVASPNWRGVPQPVKVVSDSIGQEWRAYMTVMNHKIAETDLYDKEADARAELLPFAQVINWRNGYPLDIGGWSKESVYTREDWMTKYLDSTED